MPEKTDTPTATEAAFLTQVLERFDAVEDPRMRQLLQAAIAHLHTYVDETKPSPEELRASLGYLAAVGQACTDKRQEFGLLSDLLGVSTAVDRAGYGAQGVDTPSCAEGPFYVPGSPDIPIGGSIVLDTMVDGEPVVMRGFVRGNDGQAIAGAVVDVWQTAPNRLYAVTDDGQSDFNLRGRMRVDARGFYEFHTVKPVPYSVPTDGPGGVLVRAIGGDGMRPAHTHIRVEAPGYKTLVTQVFPSGDAYLESDPAFGAAPGLIADFKPVASNGVPAYIVDFDFVLLAL